VDKLQAIEAVDAGAGESDFSPRKIKVAAGVMAGQIFATSILPFAAMSLVLVSAFAAPLIGNIFDRTHSYDIAFYMMAASGLVAAAVWLLLPRYRYGKNIAAPRS
jgi:hypothetical protein